MIKSLQTLLKSENKCILYEDIAKIVIKCLNDPYERCRELSCEIFILILQENDAEKLRKLFPFLVQILTRKLSSEEEYEPSEEVRIKMLDIVTSLLELFSKDMIVYVDDFVSTWFDCVDDCVAT